MATPSHSGVWSRRGNSSSSLKTKPQMSPIPFGAEISHRGVTMSYFCQEDLTDLSSESTAPTAHVPCRRQSRVTTQDRSAPGSCRPAGLEGTRAARRGRVGCVGVYLCIRHKGRTEAESPSKGQRCSQSTGHAELRAGPGVARTLWVLSAQRPGRAGLGTSGSGRVWPSQLCRHRAAPPPAAGPFILSAGLWCSPELFRNLPGSGRHSCTMTTELNRALAADTGRRGARNRSFIDLSAAFGFSFCDDILAMLTGF